MTFNVNPSNFRTLRGLVDHALCNNSSFTDVITEVKFGQPPRKTLVIALENNTFNKAFDVPIKLPEKTLVWVSGSAASNNTAVSAELSFVLIHNNNL